MVNILIKKIEESLTETEDIELLKKICEPYPFELDNFQKQACFRTSKNENVLVTAHTGSGKSIMAEHAILESIRLGKKAIYTSPIKSLSNQKFFEFTKKFADKMSVGILTGDIKFNPDADCVIMTTEILRNLLYKKNTNNEILEKTLTIDIDIYNDVHAVIFDEVHYINDKDRGKVWEECIILLPSKINLVMLSATIDRAEDFAQWVENVKQKPMNLIPTSHRVVPLKHYFYVLAKMPKNKTDKRGKKYDQKYLQRIRDYSNQMTLVVDDKGNYFNNAYEEIRNLMNDCYKNYNRTAESYLINTLLNELSLKGRLPCLFFVFSRKKCLRYAKYVEHSLNDSQQQAEVKNTISKQLHRLEEPSIYINSPQLLEMQDMLMKGVAIHHSGLIPVLKEIIEILFSKGLIKVLFATETFAVGVNMPTKTVIFTDLCKYSSESGLRMMHTHEYLQMSGRAGRRGLDKFGDVIILPNMWRRDYDPPGESLKTMMTGKSQVITSKFDLNYQFLLKVILTESSKISGFIENTLLNREYIQRKYYLQRELENLKETVDKIPELQYTDEQFDEYYYLLHPQERISFGGFTVKMSKKAIKTNQKKIKAFKKKSGFIKEYQKYLENYDIKAAYRKLQRNFEHNNTIIYYELIKVLRFLQEYGYINFGDILDTINPDEIGAKHITQKGIIGSQINECNEILLTELIVNGIFDELDIFEIIAIASLFIDTKPLDDENCTSTHTTLNISSKLRNTIDKSIQIKDIMENAEGKYNISLETDWDLNFNMIIPSMSWASGKHFGEIYYGNFEGNFIKDMIKINNIINDLQVMAEFLGKLELMSKCSKIEDKIIRDMVTVDSLYIKN